MKSVCLFVVLLFSVGPAFAEEQSVSEEISQPAVLAIL